MATDPFSSRLIKTFWVAALLFILSIEAVTCFFVIPQSIHATTRAPTSFINPLIQRCQQPNDQFEEKSLSDDQKIPTILRKNDRRLFIASTFVNMVIATSMSTQAIAAATTTTDATPSDITSSDKLSQKISGILRAIPVFTIVDRRGVPFMVVGDDAKVTAYFFTTYNEASRILKLASTSADSTLLDLGKEIDAKRKSEGKKPLTRSEREVEVGVNLWKEARISTVRLDFAVKLASRGQVGGSYFKVAPAEEDVEDALNIDKTESELKEGKVPLFYFEDFEINSKEGGEAQIPLYFQKKQLIQDWKKVNAKKGEVPEVKVTELLSVLNKIAETQPDTAGNDEDIGKLVLIPPLESKNKATECAKKGRNEAPFILGERIVVL